LAGVCPLRENVQVIDVGLVLTIVPYIVVGVSGEARSTELWELKPVPVIVTVTSPWLGAVAGEILVTVGVAVAGITVAASRRIRLTKRVDRFMLVLPY
jgi:hypothetical protein